MTDHSNFDQLCDLADGAIAAAAESRIRDHLRTCDTCAARFASLSALDARTAALPHEIAPPPELWNDIRAELKPRRVAARWQVSTWHVRELVVAAAIIAVASSALTTVVLRRNRTQPDSQVRVATADSAPGAIALPGQLASDEYGYAQSVAVFQRTLDERRDSLAPTTIATVERSLRIADSAIAEARAALARDPSNRALAKLFASNYERKIDLLRRATELAPRT